MRIGAHHVFLPGLVPSVMLVLGLPLLIALGFWQLDRAEQKGRLVGDFAGMADVPPLAMDAGRMEELPPQYRAVVLVGEYLAESFLNDNRTHDGQAGYHVLTPLRIEGSETALLVNRGWVPGGLSREKLPVFETPAGRIEVRGTVYLPSDRQIMLGPEEAHGGVWPRVIQQIDFAALEDQLGVKLLHYTLRLSKEAPGGFVRDWRPHYGIGPENHVAYAVQWFSIAAVFLVVYLVHGIKRDESLSKIPEARGRQQ